MTANKSNRGGKREGAGRKQGEGSTRVSVPNGCLELVLKLIEDYKSGNAPCVPSSSACNLEQIAMPLSPFSGISAEVVDANRTNLEHLAVHCDDLPGLLQELRNQTSGDFRKAWDSLPKTIKLKAIKEHKTPHLVYRAGGRVVPKMPPFINPMIFWLD